MPAHETLSLWESFYVIVGSSAAALTGLQFVVIALVAESSMRGSLREVDAFGTPTVVHFAMVLLASAVLSAPWHTMRDISIALALVGIGGFVYAVIVHRRARRTEGYKPVLEDWIWHVILPYTAYIAITIAAIVLASHAELWLFVIGGAALLLLFIGIHNAWDTVTWVAVGPGRERGELSDSPAAQRTATETAMPATEATRPSV